MEESPASSSSGLENDAPENIGAIAVELGRTCSEKKRALDRYKEGEKWIWMDCLTGGSAPKAKRLGQKRDVRLLVSCDVCHDFYIVKDKHCQCCHATFESSSPRVHFRFVEHTRECEEKRRRGDPNWKLRGATASMPSRLQLLKAELLTIEVGIEILLFLFKL